MAAKLWWIWMILAAAFVMGEIFTAGFFLFWFGIAAAAAGVCALLGLGPVWQWGAFFFVSAVLLSLSRKFADRFSRKQPPGIGADRFIGKSGVVLEAIDSRTDLGKVRMDKEEWRAQAESEEIIPVGARVKIVRLDGTHLVVSQWTKEE